jgi:hypothetical protein
VLGVRVICACDASRAPGCSGHTAVTLKDRLYVIGGTNDREVFSEVESRREELDRWQLHPEMHSPRCVGLMVTMTEERNSCNIPGKATVHSLILCFFQLSNIISLCAGMCSILEL